MSHSFNDQKQYQCNRNERSKLKRKSQALQWLTNATGSDG